MALPHRSAAVVAATAAALLAACGHSDDVTTTTRPPLAGVRYVHAVNDTSRVYIAMVDQIDYSANTIDSIGGIRYRQATRYFPVEAKARHIRVFSYADVATPVPNTRGTDAVSQIMVDTTISFDAGKNYTLLLVGSARATGGATRMRFVSIEDTPPAVDTTRVHVRVINANTGGAVDAYSVATATTAPSGTPTIAGVASGATSSYVALPVGPFALRITDAGSTTPTATITAGTGTAGTASINPIAGSNVGGTAFTAYVFAPAVTGSGAFLQQGATVTAAFNARGVDLFVDRVPPATVK